VQIVNESEQLVRKTLNHMRLLTNELHPPLLALMGLWPAVVAYAEKFGRNNGIQISIAAPERTERLSAAREIAVFRVVQECLVNVRRHSESDRASIRAWTDRGRLPVEVADSGKRFSRGPDGSLPVGLGIVGMRERARQLGGKLEIESKPRGGATVRLSIPISTTGPVLDAEPALLATPTRPRASRARIRRSR
jgi:two-component system, NarL family, sensor histidine kinase UhpB